MKNRDGVDLIGRCPICRVELVGFGNFVTCPNGDYRALFPKWDEIWTAFNPKTDSAEKLLGDLVKLNQVEISPEKVRQSQKKALEE